MSSIQTPGGCGALRVGAEVIHAAAPGARVWVSDPTWPVHIPLLGSVELEFKTYRYYESASHSVNFDGMLEDLKQAKAGDVVLLHGCCHNPCVYNNAVDEEALERWVAHTYNGGKLRVPVLALYSESDGIVGAGITQCQGDPGYVTNVAVIASHVGFPFNPIVFAVIANHLVALHERWAVCRSEYIRSLVRVVPA